MSRNLTLTPAALNSLFSPRPRLVERLVARREPLNRPGGEAVRRRDESSRIDLGRSKRMTEPYDRRREEGECAWSLEGSRSAAAGPGRAWRVDKARRGRCRTVGTASAMPGMRNERESWTHSCRIHVLIARTLAPARSLARRARGGLVDPARRSGSGGPRGGRVARALVRILMHALERCRHRGGAVGP